MGSKKVCYFVSFDQYCYLLLKQNQDPLWAERKHIYPWQQSSFQSFPTNILKNQRTRLGFKHLETIHGASFSSFPFVTCTRQCCFRKTIKRLQDRAPISISFRLFCFQYLGFSVLEQQQLLPLYFLWSIDIKVLPLKRNCLTLCSRHNVAQR